MRTSKTNLSVIDNTGTRVQPRIVVGEGGDYKSGDILDANAVMQEMPDVDGISETLDNYDERITALENSGSPSVVNILGNGTTISYSITPEDKSKVITSIRNGIPVIGRITVGYSSVYQYCPIHLIDTGAGGATTLYLLCTTGDDITICSVE